MSGLQDVYKRQILDCAKEKDVNNGGGDAVEQLRALADFIPGVEKAGEGILHQRDERRGKGQEGDAAAQRDQNVSAELAGQRGQRVAGQKEQQGPCRRLAQQRPVEQGRCV